MKRILLIILVLIILEFGTISCPILAEDVLENNSQDTINELQNRYNETKTNISGANEKIIEIETGLSESMQQIQLLNERIDEYQTEMESLGKEAENLKVSIDELENRLAIAEKEYVNKKEILEERLIVFYETSKTTYLDVLLNSKSLTDFISRYYLINQIIEYDEKVLEESDIEKTRLEVAKTTLESQRQRYRNARDNAEKTAILLENTRIIKNNYINQLTEEEKQLQEQIETYNQQIKELEAEIVVLTTANIGSDYIGGGFIWPVPGYTRISSAFGIRVHPITGINKLHTGTDISAPVGTNFLAMNSGYVIKAGFNSAYGNMVIIDHGGGISTLYAHGDEILVTVGQFVNKGEPVLKVGSTGYSTGPHAHFEIRINGEYMDPMKFVSPN